MDKTLVVMAAGLGSRYGGVKQIEHLGPDGEILMEYAIYDALAAGFNKIVLIVKPEILVDVKELFGDRIEKSTGIKIDYAIRPLYRKPSGIQGQDKALRHRPRRHLRKGLHHHALCRHERRRLLRQERL